ncbi:MAG: bifunctional folylpolyglutamate synthase/dihydrofolate synthase, partial [Muribaculaceae bacterium]|nr:bifunctional folylpolyglutamate synthase/dihydrofolate synthase [Muribaculaceae bacterium]
HNEAGIRYTMQQLDRIVQEKGGEKHIVMGFVADKAIDEIIGLLPKEARYYLTQASIPRALAAERLYEKFRSHGIEGTVYPSPKVAVEAAKAGAEENDVIYIGGSTFVVADFLT